jgi:signal transduction histidine kinase
MNNSDIRILIAEDSAIQAEKLRRSLAAAGYSVVVTRDGVEGLLKARELKPKLVISDINMPEMSGFELCRHIKSDADISSTPVILLTSLSDPIDVISALECGADNFIVKPYDEGHLLEKIQYIFLNRELQKHSQTQTGVEIHFAGRKYFITSEKKQILDLLISTYENAVQKNAELIKIQEELEVLNEELEQKVLERTADIAEEIEVRKKAEEAKNHADAATHAKSEFLSSMSHELRSPLNAILGFAQLMESESPPPTSAQKESIAQILQAGWHLLELINEILDLAKVESGQVPISQEPVSLGEVLLECRGMIEPQAQQRDIHMTFPAFEIPYVVNADRIRVKQVLINLLSNAIKYNREQGTVEVKCTAGTSGRIRISIKDSGVGLNPEQMAQLFQPFNRLGQEAGGEEGTGIGLVVAKKLVELMGGVIGVESTVGVGSVFWFELNLVAGPHLSREKDEKAALVLPHVPHGAQLRTLLYVEDNQANLKLVEQIIVRHPDIRLLTAVNGNLGIEMARNKQPDVILMDINLPGINGFEAMKILREDPATAHIPVIAVTANAMPLDIERGIKAGFFRYITKPIKVNEFMEALDVALEFAGKKSAKNK